MRNGTAWRRCFLRSTAGRAVAGSPHGDQRRVVPDPGWDLLAGSTAGSRGGWTTKIHLVADRRCRPIARLTSPGHHADCPRLIPLMESIRILRRRLGRPRRRPGRALADKPYSSAANRAHLRRRGIQAVIPVKEDQKAHRRNCGSAGGRTVGPRTYVDTARRSRNRQRHPRPARSDHPRSRPGPRQGQGMDHRPSGRLLAVGLRSRLYRRPSSLSPAPRRTGPVIHGTRPSSPAAGFIDRTAASAAEARLSSSCSLWPVSQDGGRLWSAFLPFLAVAAAEHSGSARFH
jgi:Transposase DDE domain